MNMRACCLIFVATLVLVALIAGGGYAHWRYPSPLGCSVGLVRPQKFKIDVTDFWAPHVSAAVRTPSERTPSERPPSERPSVRASALRASALRPPPSALRPPPSALGTVARNPPSHGAPGAARALSEERQLSARAAARRPDGERVRGRHRAEARHRRAGLARHRCEDPHARHHPMHHPAPPYAPPYAPPTMQLHLPRLQPHLPRLQPCEPRLLRPRAQVR